MNRRTIIFAALAVLTLAAPARAQPTWTQGGVVASGNQFDVVTDGSQRIYAISDQFVELDADALVLASDDNVGDARQGDLDFPPAIALGPDGSVHVLTRHGGNFDTGHELRYRKRSPTGSWDVDMSVGATVARNYVVGLAVLDDGRVFFAHSRQVSDVNATISFYELTNGVEVSLGAFSGSGWLRTDADFRMRGAGDRVVLASGSPWPNGTVHYFSAAPGGDLVGSLEASHAVHQAGDGRKGMPDVYVDGQGGVVMTYGALHEVYFNRYVGPNGQLASDELLFDGLGDWHLSLGLSAVAASADGHTVVVALRSDGSKTAADSDLLWSYASQSGSWSDPADVGDNTKGGEGRLRPRLVSVGDMFHLFYRSTAESGVSVKSLSLGGVAGSGGSAGAAGSAGSGGTGGSGGSSGGQAGASGSGGSPATGGSSGQEVDAGGGTGGLSASGGASGGASSSSESDGGGCSCRTAGSAGGGIWMLLGVVLSGVLRRAEL